MSAKIQKLPEIKIVVEGDNLISPDIQTECNALALNAASIKTVATAEHDANCGLAVTSMRAMVKSLKSACLEKTLPLRDATKLINDFFATHAAPLELEIERLKKLGTNFTESENRRVEAEEKIRAAEFEKAQQAQFSATSPVQEMIARRKVENIIATPEPEVNRAKGKTTKQVLKWEVTDLMELVKHNPQLCKIEPKASAINSTCHPNLPVPGLKLWFETESNYTTR